MFNLFMVELIPIIDIHVSDTNIRSPKAGPFWENTADWSQYFEVCFAKAGFPDPFPMYLKGWSFCRIEEITDNNLLKLVKHHTKDLREGKYTREQAVAFFGGYVLRIDGNDKYFPQCCSDLSDIQYWEKLAYNGEVAFYQGHPEPMVNILNNRIIFDFTVDEFEESFVPPVPEKTIEVDKTELATAVTSVKRQLESFANKLIAINISENLGISDIDRLLIWGDNMNI